MSDQRETLHPLFDNFLTRLLVTWDEPVLGTIMSTLRESLVRLPVNKEECTADFAPRARWPVPRGTSVIMLPLIDAAGYLAEQLRQVHLESIREERERGRGGWNKRSTAWAEAIKNASRALFMVCFFFDGRLRRLVMTPHRCHKTVWGTLPPRRARLKSFLDMGAYGVCETYVHALRDMETLSLHKFATLSALFVGQLKTRWITSCTTDESSRQIMPSPSDDNAKDADDDDIDTGALQDSCII